ncbi:BREX-1 system adenine-specific DNA-methyltransferase PglX [Pseudomonas sp. MF5691]|uniref:BREX-1 system adenine-specific DNA-methyltransferase PglX n=1 Tax=Pseudomonas TaxID=286 RepID=UPI0018E7FE21|nr:MULTISPECIES: BREX-1 system adenine-specific DNA-methyltransferase PglX [Pseudomonas]MBJ2291199.1 BREX-1 system adenine-specific DNA-methyltransferase PglX [Pseudomonas sp. MF5691]MBM6446147.1 BREX-1 system adenine-specific DNA-methyltransferase PglX [Pseudomonas sp. MIL9]MCT8950038.1 BREX-1 system adenine-specific DNA-methyltransferase PglX [Pseudomonas iridis]
MNTSNIKSYAPKARTAFIAAMTKRAALFGIRESSMGIAPVEQKGDLALIGEQAFPASIIGPRAALVKKVEQLGFAQAMEQAAYSWFNRLCAIRYMELKDYLDHGLRVLSHPAQQGSFQILDDCLDINLPGLDKKRIAELKLDGNKDEELYRELLLAQCHALHQAMPFLFEAVDDATELLLPDNLTKTDSLIRELVSAIPEEDWANIEIIGWLYQFYISEKKGQVIGKVVKSEDIPAATQLFTPNWIVKYMVQNSLGAQWLATYPNSPLRAQMEYYIQPTEQTAEVKVQLAAFTPESLHPEELTLIDPASGSGHILVVAYDLLKAIYLERGYRQRDVAQLILEKNLFGLDIDERAAQLTGFALMMKGRGDDRRLFERGVKLSVMALVDSAGFDADVLASGVTLADYGLELSNLKELKRLFEHATTFGSLIQVPEGLADKLPALKRLSVAFSQDLFVKDELNCLRVLVQQAEMLATRYDAVVANPPYMGSKLYCPALKEFVNSVYEAGKSDLYAAFTLRNIELARDGGRIGMITIPNWMFLSSFELVRRAIFRSAPISSLVHIGRGVWGSDFGSCSYVLERSSLTKLEGQFLRLFDKQGSVASNEELERRFHSNRRFSTPNTAFEKIPGIPVAYWASEGVRGVFEVNSSLGCIASAKQGLSTADNDRFVRLWHEVSLLKTGFDLGSRDDAKQSKKTWFPLNKGGAFRKWFGNQEFVVNWQDDGRELHSFKSSVLRNSSFYFKPSVSWSDITISHNSFREYDAGFIHSNVGHSAFGGDSDWRLSLLAYCNTNFVGLATKLLSPTVHFDVGYFNNLPYAKKAWTSGSKEIAKACVAVARKDWDAYEVSWGFQSLPLLTASSEEALTLESSYTAWITQNRATIDEIKLLEEENNRLFIDAYGLTDELTPDVPIDQITLTVNPSYRYGGKLNESELWARFREDTCAELISYAIGCMLGRYSLNEPGLIYANSGNQGFNSSRYVTFPADADGIIPLTDKEWFADDAVNRLIEFVSVAWGKTHLEANLHFLADNMSPKKAESSRETLRRYLCENYFKDHLQTYKKRPIYWLFSSGKQKAFQCLVYLHRYHEGTLARMRTEYVIPLTAKLNTYANKLEQDIEASPSTAEKKRLEKELATLHNQQAELTTFDEKLRHHADQRISLDLDDGVKVNYGKFGELLAEVKAVTGDKAES